MKEEPVARFCVCGIVIALVLVVGSVPPLAQAQSSTGAICVSAFADTNGNGVQDLGENSLAGVNVNLATGGAIIATHITDEANTQYCFENLLRGEYVITFTDAPTYQPTTPREGTFLLDPGQRLTVDPFGAIPVPLDSLRAAVAERTANQDDSAPLDQATRLLLATVGSMMVMLFLIGLGAVVLGVFSTRRGKAVDPPSNIHPPQR